MAHLDWILVAFGAAIALAGGWIQLHPEHIYPRPTDSWPLDAGALSQLRRLGASFLFMGVFFALQMTIDLTRLPWWRGTLGGLFAAIAAVLLVQAVVRGQRRRAIQPPSLTKEPIEVG